MNATGFLATEKFASRALFRFLSFYPKDTDYLIDKGESTLTEGPSAELLAAMQAKPVVQSEDQLAKLHDAIAHVRDLERTKSDQEASLKETNLKLQEQRFKILPELLDGIGIAKLTIDAEGNLPAVEAKVENYFHANIAADWEENKRQDAFNYLEDLGHGDLIKTEVTVAFPKEERDKALEFVKMIRSKGYDADVSVSQNVHWRTLTKWLQEMIEKRKIMPDLDKIGATVGRICKLKDLD